ncbi:MAG TPA: Crp/Fnr family transcriptional regulator [Chitinophagaceae bacterium]|nr:Crp/Fnr family transcriptional regulator [Chitinophagaceae bacterium]
MADNDQVLLLRRCSLWSDLSDEEYKELDVADNFKEVKKGEYVYFEAFNHNVIYFIKKGNILLGKIDDSGTVITKDILKPGDFFGQFVLERSSLDGEFAKAIKSDISLCSFTTENFVRLLKNNPVLSLKYTKLVGWRLRKFENRLVNIIQKDTRARLMLFMRELLYDKLDGKPALQEEMEIPNYLTHEEIARLIGSSRQTVTTLLNELKEEKIIEHSRNAIKFMHISKYFSREAILR